MLVLFDSPRIWMRGLSSTLSTTGIPISVQRVRRRTDVGGEDATRIDPGGVLAANAIDFRQKGLI